MNNFKRVIALSVMVIMVVSIVPVGVFAEDAPTVYWDKDIAGLSDEFLGDYANSKEAPIETKSLSFVNGGDVSGTVSFGGDVVIDDLSNFGDVPTDDTRKGKGIKLTTNSSLSDEAEKTEVIMSFDNSAYTDVVKIDFDVLFGSSAEHFRVELIGSNGSTYIWWHDSYDLLSANGNGLNSNNMTYTSSGRKANKWEKWSIVLDMKDGSMRFWKNGSPFTYSADTDTSKYIGTTGKLQKVQFYRDNTANETYVCLDNISVRSYKEAPVFIDAEGNPAPTTGILATKELNVKLDSVALLNDAVISKSNYPFVLKEVSNESIVGIHTVTPVGEDNCQFKLFLDSKLKDDTQYKLVAENVKDSTGKTANAEYIFTTTARPSNFGVYKTGYVDESGDPKDTFGVGETVKANLQVENTSGAAQTVTGAVVIYKQTENGIEMCGIQEHTKEIGDGEDYDFTPNLSTIISDNTTSVATGFFAKTFAWKGDLTGAKFLPFDATSNIGD